MSSNFDIFQNSNYNFDRLPKKTLILRWNPSEDNFKDINLELVEPLKIDVLSDIYLDNFTTFHKSITSAGLSGISEFTTAAKSAFVLDINEFNIHSNAAGVKKSGVPDTMSNMFNNIVIPSDSLSNASTTISGSVTKSHKSKKMNFICSINPTVINTIKGKITDLDGGNIFFSEEDMFLAEFVIVARK
tara:strand:+ start:186 stop:749 length:564 start_codon:yes stop_codon:yes gene_type:complete